MARMEDLAFAPSSTSTVANTTHAACTATWAAPAAGHRHYVRGISVSASAVPAAAVQIQLKDGTTVLDQFEVGTAAFAAPIVVEYAVPFRGTEATATTLSVPDLGANVACTAVIRGFVSD